MTSAANHPPTAPWGLLAEFDSDTALVAAARAVREAGFRRWDTHSPFPIHGMDRAMGLGRSPLGKIVFVAGLLGAATGMGLQWFANAYDYPLITQAKPYFSWQAFVPVTFELMVLFAAFAAVFGMFLLNGLPQWYHPALKSDHFARASNDGFFLVIEAADKHFDPQQTRRLLEANGAVVVTELEP